MAGWSYRGISVIAGFMLAACSSSSSNGNAATGGLGDAAPDTSTGGLGGAGGAGTSVGGAGGVRLAERLCGQYQECGLIQLPLEECVVAIAGLYDPGDGGADVEQCAASIRAFDQCRVARSCAELQQMESYGDACVDAGGLAGYPFCATEAQAYAAACPGLHPDCL
jgi:hypothetical protein